MRTVDVPWSYQRKMSVPTGNFPLSQVSHRESYSICISFKPYCDTQVCGLRAVSGAGANAQQNFATVEAFFLMVPS